MTSCLLALAKSVRLLAAATASPLMNAIAVGPASWPSNASTPASLAAMAVRVFLTTENLVSWPRETRSCLSCATVSPRYSVRTAAFDSLKSLVISATAETLLGVAITLLPGIVPVCPGPRSKELKLKNAPRRCTGLVSTRSMTAELCFVHLRRPPYVQGPSTENPLRSPGATAEVSLAWESGFPTTDGLWSSKLTGHGARVPNRARRAVLGEQTSSHSRSEVGEFFLPETRHARCREAELLVDLQQVAVLRGVPGVQDPGVRELFAEPLHVGDLDQQPELVAAVFLQHHRVVLEDDVRAQGQDTDGGQAYERSAGDVLDGGDHRPAALGYGDFLRFPEDAAVEHHFLGIRPRHFVLACLVFQRGDGLEPLVRTPVRPVVQTVAAGIGFLGLGLRVRQG